MNSWNFFVRKFKDLGFDAIVLSKIYKSQVVQDEWGRSRVFPSRREIRKIGISIIKDKPYSRGAPASEKSASVETPPEEAANVEWEDSESEPPQQRQMLVSLKKSIAELADLLSKFGDGGPENRKYPLKIGIAPGDHVLLPTTSRINHIVAQQQHRWSRLAYDLREMFVGLDDEKSLGDKLSKVFSTIWTKIDTYILNSYYKNLLKKNAIKRIEITEEEEVEPTLLEKCHDLKNRASLDQTIEYLVPVIAIVPKERRAEAMKRGVCDAEEFNAENYDYIIYVIYNTESVMRELRKASSQFVRSGMYRSSASVIGQSPLAAVELPFDPESSESDENRFETSQNIVDLTNRDVLWKMLLMCMHAIAHVNTFVGDGYHMYRGCEHDDVFNKELMQMFPITFMNNKYLPPFAKNVMNLSDIAYRL